MDSDDNIVSLGNGSLDAIVGRNVRLHRLRSSQTQESVSQALDLPLADYRRGEAGQRRFNAVELMTLCSQLHARPADLMKGVLAPVDHVIGSPDPAEPAALSRDYLLTLADSLPNDDLISLAFLCRRMFGGEGDIK